MFLNDLSTWQLPAADEAIVYVCLLFFRLEAWALRRKLQHRDFLIVAVGSKALLVHRLGKPDASLLHDAGQRRIGTIASCRKGLRGAGSSNAVSLVRI